MAQEWFFYRNGEQRGPVSSAMLKDLVGKGRIARTDLVWREGLDDWTPAGEIKGLFRQSARGPEIPTTASKVKAAAPNSTGVSANRSTAEKFCHACGATIDRRAEICPKCGVRQPGAMSGNSNDVPSKVMACLFAMFLGLLGAHHFYLGRTGLGVLYLLLNLLFCWTIFVPVVFGIICVIEGLVFLTYSDAQFEERYRRR